jgi:uncharacterized protein YicC (UPF0701 family)
LRHQINSIESESAQSRQAGIQAKVAVHLRSVNQRNTSFQPHPPQRQRQRQRQLQQSHSKLCNTQPSLKIDRALCTASALLVRESYQFWDHVNLIDALLS